MAVLRATGLTFNPRDNATAHNTSAFHVLDDPKSKTAVVRRGQPFTGSVLLDKPYDESKDQVQLVFSLGDGHRSETKGSMFIRRDAVADKHEWTAKLTDIKEKKVSFEVCTPVTLPVGAWGVKVVTRQKVSTLRHVYESDEKVYILFNPWNPDDQTYMKESNLLQEYVLSDIGKVWMNEGYGKPWYFGQFDVDVLPACMYILQKGEMPLHLRGDPVQLARVLTKVVNSNDEGGVLAGRWREPYDDGKAPWEWKSSADILSKYLKSKKSVRYGQCWVFAAVLNTVCRALGIPCRVVTNMVSGHDGNNNLIIEEQYTENMKEKWSPDSIWNFHVWNDAWMARPDLPEGYGGWQAIDATPQEKSQGVFQCGPASVEAVKQGMIGFGYDASFVLAEINADVIKLKDDPESELGYSIIDTITNHVGRMLLTKKPFVFDPAGNNDVEDVKDQYKYKEGTPSERLTFLKGVHSSGRAARYYDMLSGLKRDVTFKLRQLDKVPFGEDFSVTVDVHNTSNKAVTINAMLSATSVFYHGVKGNIVKEQNLKIVLEPQKKKEISIVVSTTEYLPKLLEYCNMKISAMAMVEETKYTWAEDDLFQLVKPKISIKCDKVVVVNQPTTVELSLQNPLNQALTGCQFKLLSTDPAIKTFAVPAPDVAPHGLVSAKVEFKPSKVGQISFIASFKSQELQDVNGAANAEVRGE